MEYQLSFIDRIERTATAMSLRFRRPPGLDFTAGQYMLVTLNPGLVHPLSLSDDPGEKGFVEFTKRMTGSRFCRHLLSLAPGDGITVRGPMGRFVGDGGEKYLVFIAGGIGITPIRSIMKSLVRSRGNLERVILLYGNTNPADIAFRREIEDLDIPSFRVVHVLADPGGESGHYQGFINGEIIAAELTDIHEAIFMVSGPPVMVAAVEKALLALGVGGDRIRTDIFLGY